MRLEVNILLMTFWIHFCEIVFYIFFTVKSRHVSKSMTLLKLFFVSTSKSLHLETSIFKAMMGGHHIWLTAVSSNRSFLFGCVAVPFFRWHVVILRNSSETLVCEGSEGGNWCLWISWRRSTSRPSALLRSRVQSRCVTAGSDKTWSFFGLFRLVGKWAVIYLRWAWMLSAVLIFNHFMSMHYNFNNMFIMTKR